MNSKKCILVTFLIGLLVIPILLSTGCELIGGYKVSNIGNGYNLFVLKKGIGHFSFEYLSKYNLGIVETRTDEHHYTNVTFDDWDNKTQTTFTSFDIFLDQEDAVPSAEAMLNGRISLHGQKQEYNLIELSSINIAGIPAKLYWYSFKMPEIRVFEFGGGVTPPTIWVDKEIYFDYNGVVWNVQMQSPVKDGQHEIEDFDHIIQTFKILK